LKAVIEDTVPPCVGFQVILVSVATNALMWQQK